MAESTILKSPVLLLLYGTALCLSIADLLHFSKKGRLSVISAAVTAAASAWAIILGAQTGEVITVLLLFLCLNLEGWK